MILINLSPYVIEISSFMRFDVFIYNCLKSIATISNLRSAINSNRVVPKCKNSEASRMTSIGVLSHNPMSIVLSILVQFRIKPI